MSNPQVIRLGDLTEDEISNIEEKVAEGDSSYVIDRKKEVVEIHDPNAVDLSGDPTEGVDVSSVPMPDQVREILESPFAEENPKEEAEAEKDEKPEEPIEEFEVEEADVRNFIRCMLGNKRFTKTYSAYGDKFKFVLGDRTQGMDSDAISRAMKPSAIDAIRDLTYAHIAYSLVSITTGSDTTTFEQVEPGKMAKSEANLADQAMGEAPSIYAIDMRISELQKLPQPIFRVISDSMADFNKIINTLVERANDPKYWETVSAV